MSAVIMDCDLMRFPNSGLYFYCVNLMECINEELQQQGRELMHVYLPPYEKCPLPPESYYIREKKYHKFWKPFMRDCRVWHAPFQSGRIFPDKRKHKDTKIVLTVHDLNVLHEGKGAEEQKKSLAHTQSLIDKSDTVICISQFAMEDVIKNCDVSGKDILFIHNGANKIHEPRLAPASYKPKRPFLFGIGYVNRKKNYLVLLPLLLQNPEMEMIISGRLDEPDYVNLIRKEAERLNVADRLTITGPINEQEKAWYISNCTAFLHPSLAEGFGATVIEAMSFGKPVFLSRRTSLPEIGGEEAYYFDTFDVEAMNSVFRQGMHIMETTDMKDRLLARAAKFCWKDSAKKYIAVYDKYL